MNSSHDFPETQAKRAQWFKIHGGVNAVVEAGLLSNTVSMGLTEVLVLADQARSYQISNDLGTWFH